MATNNNAKSEIRRKRIQDAGTDRLALITGRIQALPQSPRSPPSNLHSRNESTPASFFSPHHYHETPRTPFDQSTAGFSDASFKMLKRERSLSYMNSKSFQNRNKLETQLHKIRTDREVLRDIIKPEPIPENVVPKPETESTTTVRDKDSVTSLITEQQNKSNNKMFSSKRINYCIVTSQEMRSACAVVVGLLVVLSNSGLRILSESVIVSSPLWSVVMTNMMMVVGLVFWENYREKEDVEFEKGQGQGQEDGSNMTDAILLMERGLVAYQMLRGIFIDFSVYFVVLVCGLSLV